MKITIQSFCNTRTPAWSRACRWRAAATSSFKPWIRRHPLADGKSPDLELRGASTELQLHLRLPSKSSASKLSTQIRRHMNPRMGMAFPPDLQDILQSCKNNKMKKIKFQVCLEEEDGVSSHAYPQDINIRKKEKMVCKFKMSNHEGIISLKLSIHMVIMDM
jgi:hypothetical protein